MRTVTIEKKLYTYDELSKASQDRVINNVVEELLEFNQENPKVKRAIEKAEKMQTPWFVGAILFELAEDEILMAARESEYEVNGSWFCLVGD